MERYDREKHGRILMHLGVVRQLVCERNGMKLRDLECLLYFYGRGKHFKYKDFVRFKKSFPDFNHQIYWLIKKGWFSIVRRGTVYTTAIYGLSQTGSQICRLFYEQLFGDTPLRTDYKYTTMFGKALPFHEKAVKSGLVDEINEENRIMRLNAGIF